MHTVRPERRGWPSVPFVAIVEAYVLRDLGLSPEKIRVPPPTSATSSAPSTGLATRRIATDGVDVFVHYLDSDEIARAGDRQMPIRRVIDDHLKYVVRTTRTGFRNGSPCASTTRRSHTVATPICALPPADRRSVRLVYVLHRSASNRMYQEKDGT